MLKASRIVKPHDLWIAGDTPTLHFLVGATRSAAPEAQGQWRHHWFDGGQSAAARWDRASFDVKSGRVVLESSSLRIRTAVGCMVSFFTCRQPLRQTSNELRIASRMPRCGSDYSRRKYRKSPVRGFRTGFSKLSQLLAKELFYSLPEGDARKLVVFSDSREDAAAIANGMERTHYLDSCAKPCMTSLVLPSWVRGHSSTISNVKERRLNQQRNDLPTRWPAATARLRRLVADVVGKFRQG